MPTTSSRGEPTIMCRNCAHEIELSERLAKAREAEKAALAKVQALRDREADLKIEVAR